MKTRFLGYQVPYAEGMRIMREAIDQIEVEGNQLLLLEHRDTITYTRQHGLKHVFRTQEELAQLGIDLFETDRGGDVTFHGTGQLVGYPILKLSPNWGVVDYIRALESALVKTCQTLGVSGAHCLPGKTGVWVNNQKLAAIGVGVSQQVTRHGFALNVSTHLERFTSHMTPCGLEGHGVTSLERELNSSVSISQVLEIWKTAETLSSLLAFSGNLLR
ncbi:MAG: lipoyl(octanoyl) transferase LipB [Myxococcaceae bacterium]|nr:lipoyl(octanoyl) transferase LipB [Myxococcaceae bacterium]